MCLGVKVAMKLACFGSILIVSFCLDCFIDLNNTCFKEISLTCLPLWALLVKGSFLSYPVLVLDELVRTLPLTPCWKALKRIRACLSRIMCK